jgi:hypothetical protein
LTPETQVGLVLPVVIAPRRTVVAKASSFVNSVASKRTPTGLALSTSESVAWKHGQN